MATVEMSREYPVEPEQLSAYTSNPRNWPTYYNNMLDATGNEFEAPGDTATCRYRILGRVVDVSVEVRRAPPTRAPTRRYSAT